MHNLSTMTVGELREALNGYDENTPVMVPYPSGDYWHTQLAGNVSGFRINEGLVQWSEYHREWKIIEADEEDDKDEESQAVLLLG